MIDEEEYWNEIEENNEQADNLLPSIVNGFVKAATDVSHHNEIPAAMSFFVILGQLAKDFIAIPSGQNLDDTRIHFLQIQTSGTGKSTLYNFVGPVAKRTFEKINDLGSHVTNTPLAEETGEFEGAKKFDTMSVIDYTDAGLVTQMAEVEIQEEDDDGNNRRRREIQRIPGLLEGSGLAHWDEFEYSGVFTTSEHKKSAIVYLNTLMNPLHGENWKITKKLKEGDVVKTLCERSVLAMTYPPKKLDEIMTQKGVLQRMVIYIWDVPEFIQDKMRRTQIRTAGIYKEVNQPIDRYVDALVKLYQSLHKRFQDVGRNPMMTVQYEEGFQEAYEFRYDQMMQFLERESPEVREVASNFTTRLLKMLLKLSVLNCIAESPQYQKDEDKFIVSSRHVTQAAFLIQNCYSRLTEWLGSALRVRRKEALANSKEPKLVACYGNMGEKDEEGWVSKKLFFDAYIAQEKVSQVQAYRDYKKHANIFEEDKVGRSVFIRITGDE